MMNRVRASAELIVVVGIVGVITLGFVVGKSYAPHGSGSAPLQSPTSAPAISDAEPTETVPPGAQVQTPEQAVARGVATVRDLGARQPRTVVAKMVPLQDALIALQRTGEAPSAATDGLSKEALGEAVWLVEFDDDEFHDVTCPAEINADGTPEACPASSTASVVIRASDGAVVQITLGLAVPR